MLLLFRFLELDEGSIRIDDVDISRLKLPQLRKCVIIASLLEIWTGSMDLTSESVRRAIAMLPQDPTLFSGSVKANIDPFGVFSDEQIWGAL